MKQIVNQSQKTKQFWLIFFVFDWLTDWLSCIYFRYVSRNQSRDSANHVILGTQQFKPTEFANQINLNMDNAWGVLRCVIDICMKLKEGKYLIMKDPNKVRLGQVGMSVKE